MVSDRLILEFDRALRTVFAGARSQRPMPGGQLAEAELSEQQRTHACGLMRVNHVGEICAQALYQGQAITSPQSLAASRSPATSNSSPSSA